MRFSSVPKPREAEEKCADVRYAPSKPQNSKNVLLICRSYQTQNMKHETDRAFHSGGRKPGGGPDGEDSALSMLVSAVRYWNPFRVGVNKLCATWTFLPPNELQDKFV